LVDRASRGLAYPYTSFWKSLRPGETGSDILAAYPQLKAEHIKACLEYAARLPADEIVLAD